MKRRFAIACLFFLVPLPMGAQEPEPSPNISVVIDGPETVNPGELVKLDARKSDADSFIWRLVGGTSKQYDVAEGGRVVYFATATPGTVRFAWAAAKNVSGKAPALLMGEKVVTVTGSVPPPNPQPVPVPDIKPEQNKLGFATLARDTVVSQIATLDKAVVRKVGDVFSVVSSKIGAGTLGSKAAADAEIKSRIREIIPEAQRAKYAAAVIVPLTTKIDARTWPNMDDYREALAEIALGIEVGSR
jgi:hypothetical protein